MARQLISILAIVYFTCGTLLLPQGNFAALADLPHMYRHCKATEDKDMTLFDFVTDHLINIDGIFDKHINGDEQKPHAPVNFYQVEQQIFLPCDKTQLDCSGPVCLFKRHYFDFDNYLPSDYIYEIFRPPII